MSIESYYADSIDHVPKENNFGDAVIVHWQLSVPVSHRIHSVCGGVVTIQIPRVTMVEV